MGKELWANLRRQHGGVRVLDAPLWLGESSGAGDRWRKMGAEGDGRDTNRGGSQTEHRWTDCRVEEVGPGRMRPRVKVAGEDLGVAGVYGKYVSFK
ncbi:hypothetical protein CRG98_040925 [Punica granatum]|uniref:Uncharacterized protein n=1 Tax=Punica granatum TaxID=22663 RepID=A0A2I0I3Z2_PUNGR|nr:hypothetical protein CRG98_040925 [Punica granatum]